MISSKYDPESVENELRRIGKMAEVQDNTENIQATLKGAVRTLLVVDHDFSIEEAEEIVENSFADKPDFWNENAVPKDLADSLAVEDDEL